MTFVVPDPVDVEIVPPNARRNPIRKLPNGKWAYTCPVCGLDGVRKLAKHHNTRKGFTSVAQTMYGISKPCDTRKQAKDALVIHVRNKHGAGLVGVRLR